jgi:hypothetical protein
MLSDSGRVAQTDAVNFAHFHQAALPAEQWVPLRQNRQSQSDFLAAQGR